MMRFFKNYLREAARDESGATTMEFCIVMPLIVFWFAGGFTFFDAYGQWTSP